MLSGERFLKPPYLWPKTPFTCGREVQTEKQNLCFRKYPDTCERGLRPPPHNINRDSGIEIPEAWISTIKNTTGKRYNSGPLRKQQSPE